MIFNSLHFLAFFVTVTTLYFALPHKNRWQLLLIASCYFYMSFVPVYILILFFTIIIDFFAGIAIENADRQKRKLYLVCSLIANIGVLAIFKYYNFLNDNLSFLLNSMGYQNSIPNLSILLPIGLSFHTFQAMSYTIEVYRGNQKAERHFGIYSLYVMFYPQLVAGPIERPQNILPQFHQKHRFDYDNVTTGLKLMTWGFFKKVVIADRLAQSVNTIYANPTEYQGLPLLLATTFFAIQIYCDFSGYSDIAIGSARVMGINLMKNFDRPYLSKSVSEFWKRWHISLSTWFRDYLYIPLGGNRVPLPRMYVNLLITFLLSGLWHGSSWTYIVWGGINGVFLICEHHFSNYKILKIESHFPLISATKTVLTFGLINITWIFFRSATLSDAFYILTHLFTGFIASIPVTLSQLSISKYDLGILVISVSILLTIELIQSKFCITDLLNKMHPFTKKTIYLACILLIILTGQFDSRELFIYFQF
jgi:alginate O-acetyltransferase complex protein AlgI